MGYPTTPQDAAPAYDDVFADHPVNKGTSSRSGYAAVAQDDDVELNAHSHDHIYTPPSSAPSTQNAPESIVSTIAGVFKPKPHVHCEQCDVQTAARQRRENEKHCCTMVAATFMVGFMCAFIFGIIVMAIIYRHKRLLLCSGTRC